MNPSAFVKCGSCATAAHLSGALGARNDVVLNHHDPRLVVLPGNIERIQPNVLLRGMEGGRGGG